VKGVNAWIVRWDWAGDAAKACIDPDKVWVFSGRLSRDAVLLIVEQIYVERFFSLEEQLTYARRGDWYRQMRKHLFQTGIFRRIPCDWEFTFGRHPYLVAVRAKNVRVVNDEGRQERFVYDPIHP
jgi:hypothetical protein